MKLSELVGYLNLLESDELAPDYHMAVKRFQEIAHVISVHPIQIDEYGSEFSGKIEKIVAKFQQAQAVLERFRL